MRTALRIACHPHYDTHADRYAEPNAIEVEREGRRTTTTAKGSFALQDFISVRPNRTFCVGARTKTTPRKNVRPDGQILKETE